MMFNDFARRCVSLSWMVWRCHSECGSVEVERERKENKQREINSLSLLEFISILSFYSILTHSFSPFF